MLPLLRAIRASLPQARVDLLIHYPVAELLEQTTGNLLNRIWHYHQVQLLRKPWRLISFFRQIRKQRYDVVITSHNPDNFSLSQALAGRFFAPRCFIGFRHGDSPHFYHIAVPSSTDKHYADAMVDLWRVIAPGSRCEFGGLEIPPHILRKVKEKLHTEMGISPAAPRVLFWLGATGNKILPPAAVEWVYRILQQRKNLPFLLAAGPADREVLKKYPLEIAENTILWEAPLVETAAFFSLFDLFISPDTGPMHLAVAVGCQTFTLFVDSNIRQYGYQQEPKYHAVQWQENSATRTRLTRLLEEKLAQLTPVGK
ncbi:MAG: hypothetical protein D6681_21270 [Calditrichaeota bacterium]|nr:MAG: hypothetical protein D6681_21270 [Calditrichota bacterium]